MYKDVPPYIAMSETLNCISWAYCLFIIIYESSKGQQSNWIIKLFWMFSFMISAIRLQTMFSEWSEDEKTYYDIYHIIRLILFGIMTTLGLFFNKERDLLKESQQISESKSLLGDMRDSYGTEERKECKVNPETTANFFSKITFQFCNELIRMGYKRPLDAKDLWPLQNEDQSDKLYKDFEVIWEEEKKRENPNLIRAIAKFLGIKFILVGILKFLNDGCVLMGPLLLNLVIKYIKDPDSSVYYGLLLASGFFGAGVLSTIFMHNYWFITLKMGQRCRSALITSIYKKCFTITSKSKQSYTTGEIVNYMSIDANTFNFLVPDIHFLWTSPIQIGISLYLLYLQVGYAMFAGLAALLLMIPLNTILAKRMIYLQNIVMENKDKRIKVLNEILQGIRIIKFFTWEKSYSKKVNEIRNVELKTLRSVAYLNAFTNFTWGSVPLLVSVSTFFVFSITGNSLTSEIAFTSLSLFNMLRVPIYFIPEIIKEMVEAVISTRRIQKYLLMDERNPNNVNWVKNNENIAVEIQNGNFTWDKEKSPILKDINIKVEKGEFIAIVGSVGAGKSSFLSSLIGDTEKLSGTVNINGTVSYSSQQAWIQNCTARDNITFGKPFDKKLYEKTVKVCQLKKDFEMLTAGDFTEIGEKGINLSGGQKQRISIARATYQDSQIYLFDDILSAVDVHVGKKIFDECLLKLLSDRTRILVTHQLQYLPPVDKIYVLKDGEIVESGKYSELVQLNGEFSRLIRSLNEIEKSESEDLHESKDTLEVEPSEKTKKESKIVAEEEKQYGNLSLEIYKNYFIAIGGLFLAFMIVFIMFLSMVMRMSSDFWLTYWSNDEAFFNHGVSYYLSIYSFLGLGYIFLILAVAVATMYGGINASKKLHDMLLKIVLRAPTSFFDTNPTGRILNRFSKDIYSVDESLPNAYSSLLLVLFNGISVIIVISIVTPIFLIVWFPLSILYRLIQKYFISSSRELKRLDALSRSPIYGHFSETLNGLTIIRSFQATDRFISENKQKIDRNVQANFLYFTVNRWLATRLEFIGTCVVTLACLFSVIERNTIDPGLAGLSLVYSLQLTGILNWLVRMMSETETEMVSVERISEYLELEQEPPSHIPKYAPPPNWPQKGCVEFKNFKLRYRKGLDLVLKGINCKIESCEKNWYCGKNWCR